jgi:hypothetical protein
MSSDTRTTVCVTPAEAWSERPRLFSALAEAFPVRFEPWTPGRIDVAGLIVIDGPRALPSAAELSEALPTLAVADPSFVSAAPCPFTLQSGPGVDRRVHGLTLTDRFATVVAGEDPVVVGPVSGGDQVLATSDGQPVWTLSRRPAPLHRLRSALPELEADEVLYALLSKRQLTAVALVQFLRELTASHGWQPAPLRAAFLFDDPNLRWRSYGYIDYKRLVRHADEHGYHAAMAMIPLDAGRPHMPTVDLFRRRADRLSLIVHGNDHTKGELLATGDDATAQTIAGQAVRRIRRFEQRAGLGVDRVMAPPHGLCSQPTTRALGAMGFDALTAIHPLPWTETPPADPVLAGWRAAEFVAGCPVVPRIPLGSSAADIGLRAFLDHPLIVYGHHEDVAGGLEGLAETAAIINGLGDVAWTSVGQIVTSNAERRRSGDQLTLRPFARRVIAPVGPDVSALVVPRPQDSIDASALCGYMVRDLAHPSAPTRSAAFGEGVPLTPEAEHRLEITLHGPADTEPRLVPPPAWRPWPKLRRVVTEMRDRVVAQTGAPAVRDIAPTEEEPQQWAA